MKQQDKTSLKQQDGIVEKLESSQPEHSSDAAFIERLNICAELAGSMNALARLTGMSQSGMRRYFVGGEPTRPVLIAIANAVNVNLLWLTTGEGEMRPGKADIEVQVERSYPRDPARTIDQMKEGVAERRRERERREATKEHPLNPQLLLEVIEAVETNLNQRDLEMRPDRKALLIQLLYEHQMDARLNKEDTTKRFFELIGK